MTSHKPSPALPRMEGTVSEKLMRRPMWPDWIASEEGKRCADFRTLTAQQYLENRLWKAFCAGYNAKVPRQEAIAKGRLRKERKRVDV